MFPSLGQDNRNTICYLFRGIYTFHRLSWIKLSKPITVISLSTRIYFIYMFSSDSHSRGSKIYIFYIYVLER
jgi:hypothetical protein